MRGASWSARSAPTCRCSTRRRRATRSTTSPTRADVPQPIGRREFHDDPGGVLRRGQEPADHRRSATPHRRWTTSASATCRTPRRWRLGRRRPPARWRSTRCSAASPFAADLPAPGAVTLDYCYGFPADIGGGPYDRGRAPAARPLEQVTWSRVVGAGATDIFGAPLTLEQAVAAFNAQPPGTVGLIVLAGFGVADIDLTGAGAIRVPARQPALDRRSRTSRRDGAWTPSRARVTLRGDIEMVGVDCTAARRACAPRASVFLSGMLLAGGVAQSRPALSASGCRTARWCRAAG